MLDDGQKSLNSEPELADPMPRSLIGIMANEAHQSRGLFDFKDYQLAIVEFDDQGRCYRRHQMKEVADWLSAHSGIDMIILVFVHGWKHDARSDDGNLASFQAVMQDTVEREKEEQAKCGKASRPILGVFVGWRGMSLYGFRFLENLTFWERQDAGRKVAVGSARELFGRFRHYRNRRRDQGGAPLLIIVGHSFGGMVVYSALAQSLIEAASGESSHVSTRFADLVLLVNPAFEAVRYLPIYDLLKERAEAFRIVAQPPVFVCATATNDRATGLAFPIGNGYCLLTESWRGIQERQAMINTVGHLDWMTTHDLKTIDASPGFELRSRTTDPQQPYWVVSAAPSVINGHNGIFQVPFLKFISALVFAHVSKGPSLVRGEPQPGSQ
jgi:hypothetical protein